MYYNSHTMSGNIPRYFIMNEDMILQVHSYDSQYLIMLYKDSIYQIETTNEWNYLMHLYNKDVFISAEDMHLIETKSERIYDLHEYREYDNKYVNYIETSLINRVDEVFLSQNQGIHFILNSSGEIYNPYKHYYLQGWLSYVCYETLQLFKQYQIINHNIKTCYVEMGEDLIIQFGGYYIALEQNKVYKVTTDERTFLFINDTKINLIEYYAVLLNYELNNTFNNYDKPTNVLNCINNINSVDIVELTDIAENDTFEHDNNFDFLTFLNYSEIVDLQYYKNGELDFKDYDNARLPITITRDFLTKLRY